MQANKSFDLLIKQLAIKHLRGRIISPVDLEVDTKIINYLYNNKQYITTMLESLGGTEVISPDTILALLEKRPQYEHLARKLSPYTFKLSYYENLMAGNNHKISVLGTEAIFSLDSGTISPKNNNVEVTLVKTEITKGNYVTKYYLVEGVRG